MRQLFHISSCDLLSSKGLWNVHLFQNLCKSQNRWGSFPIPISQQEIIFNATAACCFNLQWKIQGWWGTRTAAEHSRPQAHPCWKDLVGSVPCHGQSWYALSGPTEGVEGYSCSLGNAAQKHGATLISICLLGCSAEDFSLVMTGGKGSHWEGDKTQVSRYLTHFGLVLSAGSSPWLFFPVSYFQMDVLNPICQTWNRPEQHEISQKAAGNWEFWSWSN